MMFSQCSVIGKSAGNSSLIGGRSRDSACGVGSVIGAKSDSAIDFATASGGETNWGLLGFWFKTFCWFSRKKLATGEVF